MAWEDPVKDAVIARGRMWAAAGCRQRLRRRRLLRAAQRAWDRALARCPPGTASAVARLLEGQGGPPRPGEV